MNTFLIILQVISLIVGFVFLSKSWNKETKTLVKDSFQGAISCAVLFFLFGYFQTSEIQINNIEEANKILLNKSKGEVVKLLGKPDFEHNIGGENYYEYDSSQRGSFYQLDAAGHGKELKIYFDSDNNCNVISIYP